MAEKAKRGMREIETDSFENYRQKYPEDQPLCTYKYILESIVKTIPNRLAFIQGERRLTWKEFDERTNRIANGLLDLGLKKGDRVAINGFNSIEWMEAYWGASKAGFVPVNLNPRFVADEIKYVLKDSDSIVLFTEDRWVDTVEEIRRDLPLLKDIVVYNAPGYPPKEYPRDSIYEDYEDYMRKSSGSKPKLDWEVKNDDLCYLMYTGGTTGWPKGVVYDYWNRAGSMRWGMTSNMAESGWDKIMRSTVEDKDFLSGMANFLANAKIPLLSPLLSRIVNMLATILPERKGMRDVLYPILISDAAKRLIFQYIWPRFTGVPFAYSLFGGNWKHIAPLPLMHGAGYESSFAYLCALGAATILPVPGQPFDAREYWESVEKHKATLSTVVGDAFVIPMIEELNKAEKEGRRYDTSSLFLWVSSGVRWSAHLKRKMLDYLPNSAILDAYGTTESALAFASPVSSMDKEIAEHTTAVRTGHGYSGKNLILDMDTGKMAKPGAKHVQFVFGGFQGLGYWKAPAKAKKDWTTIDGERYFLVGDEGFLDEKGGFHLLGRGGGYVINTGGEKVYSEEVEEKIRSNPKVLDVGVIGLPDEKWGEAVTAIVELKEGEKATEEEIKEHCKSELAGFKVPKHFIFHKVLRAGAGKMDRPGLTELSLKELRLKR